MMLSPGRGEGRGSFPPLQLALLRFVPSSFPPSVFLALGRSSFSCAGAGVLGFARARVKTVGLAAVGGVDRW